MSRCFSEKKITHFLDNRAKSGITAAHDPLGGACVQGLLYPWFYVFSEAYLGRFSFNMPCASRGCSLVLFSFGTVSFLTSLSYLGDYPVSLPD